MLKIQYSWSLVINASAPGQVEWRHFLILVGSSFFLIKVKCCSVFVSLLRGMHHGISNLLICKNKMLFWSTRRSNTSSQGFTSVCVFFFFLPAVLIVAICHLVVLLQRISCTKFQEKLCFAVLSINADCTTVPLEAFIPSVQRHASVHCGHLPLNRLEQVYTEGRQHKVLWLQILNAMQDEITQIVGVRFCFVLALCVPSLCVISCLPQLPQLASCLLPQQPIVSTCPMFT